MADFGKGNRVISLKIDMFVGIFASRFIGLKQGGVAQSVRAVES